MIQTAAVGYLLASQGGAAAPARAVGAQPAQRAPAVDLAAHGAKAVAPWRPTVGCEFEIYGNDAAYLDTVVRRAKVTTAQPIRLARQDAAKLWLGQGVHIPDKGRDIGAWRVVPELAFPLDTHEVISPALTGDGIADVGAVARALTDAGMRTTGDGAFHVHVGHAGVNATAIADLSRLWGRHHDVLFALSNNNLRQRQLYARAPEPAFLQGLQRWQPQTLDALHALYVRTHQPLHHLSLSDHARRFYALNLHYLAAGATVEFRAYQFVDRPAPALATAYVEMSVALMAAARDQTAARLADIPVGRLDAPALLDALRLSAPARATLLQNLARSQGFAYFDGEVRGAVGETVYGVIAASIFWRTLGMPGRLPEGVRCAAESVMLSSAVHVGALILEAWGRITYVATYAAREWSLLHFLRIGMGLRGAAAFF